MKIERMTEIETTDIRVGVRPVFQISNECGNGLLNAEQLLTRAKVKAIDDSERLEKAYNDVIEAFKKYRGDDEE